ncbi:hypothetical protein TcasGA2_TC034791 [Tribolium castaneum]|uniref:Uncharacterized protein n=1 Tax=Tribolium castaneum TaxID=7070 RepID=A0A139WEF4_TRICA|nr:hypothetical protein TcasGA2_TC034791 [Tribolium castaneum]
MEDVNDANQFESVQVSRRTCMEKRDFSIRSPNPTQGNRTSSTTTRKINRLGWVPLAVSVCGPRPVPEKLPSAHLGIYLCSGASNMIQTLTPATNDSLFNSEL